MNHDYEAWGTRELIERITQLEKQVDEEHNGWSNYATWRVNLEMFDGINFVRDDVWGDTVADFAQQLQGDAETRIDEEFDDESRNNSYANSYSHAFIADVNWYEIAESINDAYELNLKKY